VIAHVWYTIYFQNVICFRCQYSVRNICLFRACLFPGYAIWFSGKYTRSHRLVLLRTTNDEICILLLCCIVLWERSQILHFRTRGGGASFLQRVLLFLFTKKTFSNVFVFYRLFIKYKLNTDVSEGPWTELKNPSIGFREYCENPRIGQKVIISNFKHAFYSKSFFFKNIYSLVNRLKTYL